MGLFVKEDAGSKNNNKGNVNHGINVNIRETSPIKITKEGAESAKTKPNAK